MRYSTVFVSLLLLCTLACQSKSSAPGSPTSPGNDHQSRKVQVPDCPIITKVEMFDAGGGSTTLLAHTYPSDLSSYPGTPVFTWNLVGGSPSSPTGNPTTSDLTAFPYLTSTVTLSFTADPPEEASSCIRSFEFLNTPTCVPLSDSPVTTTPSTNDNVGAQFDVATVTVGGDELITIAYFDDDAGQGGTQYWPHLVQIDAATNTVVNGPARLALGAGDSGTQNVLAPGCGITILPLIDAERLFVAVGDASSTGNFDGTAGAWFTTNMNVDNGSTFYSLQDNGENWTMNATIGDIDSAIIDELPTLVIASVSGGCDDCDKLGVVTLTATDNDPTSVSDWVAPVLIDAYASQPTSVSITPTPDGEDAAIVATHLTGGSSYEAHVYEGIAADGNTSTSNFASIFDFALGVDGEAVVRYSDDRLHVAYTTPTTIKECDGPDPIESGHVGIYWADQTNPSPGDWATYFLFYQPLNGCDSECDEFVEVDADISFEMFDGLPVVANSVMTFGCTGGPLTTYLYRACINDPTSAADWGRMWDSPPNDATLSETEPDLGYFAGDDLIGIAELDDTGSDPSVWYSQRTSSWP